MNFFYLTHIVEIPRLFQIQMAVQYFYNSISQKFLFRKCFKFLLAAKIWCARYSCFCFNSRYFGLSEYCKKKKKKNLFLIEQEKKKKNLFLIELEKKTNHGMDFEIDN